MHKEQHADMLLNYIVNATIIQELQKAKRTNLKQYDGYLVPYSKTE